MPDDEMPPRTRTGEQGPAEAPTPEVLDELAHVVAAALDDGDDARAWELTRAIEELSGADGDSGRPPGPVIGRRFARAHRLLAGRATAVLPGTRLDVVP